MKKILVVDDDRQSCEALREILQAQDWEAEIAQTPGDAMRVFQKTKFDLVISDINLEAPQSGLDLLAELRTHCPVILITGFGTLETAIEAAKRGAYDLISKPFKVRDVLAIVRRALELSDSKPNELPEVKLLPEKTRLIGRSPKMLELYKEIARVAPSKSTILIVGESGTGKELVARSIHQHSTRAQGNFLPVNCGAMTETLLEAELFGYIKGAFTGAVMDRRGLWEEAEGGTLFLDEIGETSPAMQVKLLRALQEKEIRRVGATKNLRVDARVVAATNRNLEAEITRKTFREDLFYRLSVVALHVPALRERRSDIPLLAQNFLRSAMDNAGKSGLRFAEETIHVLVAYDWPGNVRELESAIEFAALYARDEIIKPEDLPPKLQSVEIRALAERSPLAALFDDLPTLEELEGRYLAHVLDIVGGSKAKAAAVMGVDRRTLYRMAERLKIKINESEGEAET